MNHSLEPVNPSGSPAGKGWNCRRGTFILLAVLILACPRSMTGQDTIKPTFTPVKKHSIAKAAAFSAILPGLGQVYNRKAWKVPIIYAGFGVLTYFIITNQREFGLFKEAYIYKANGETGPTDNEYALKYNLSQLSEGMDYYRRNRDLAYIITGIWYTLNILEAYVDAHFFDYDISEDLTMRVGPAFIPIPSPGPPAAAGITLSFRFRP